MGGERLTSQERFQHQFGRVRALREANTELSQEEFAYFINIDRSHYGEIERGVENACLDTIRRIADGLGVHPRDLFD